jgi:transposase
MNVSLIASLGADGFTSGMMVEGSVNRAVFEAYVTKVLLPTLRPGDSVLMDNLSCHKTLAVKQAIETAGAQLLFFPAYSPDFSPIEFAFSKVKTFLRQVQAHTLDSLFDALAHALDLVSAHDAEAYFCAAGFSDIH